MTKLELEKYPQTPLEIKLSGRRYRHSIVCSMSDRKPVGTPGCCCLNILKRSVKK